MIFERYFIPSTKKKLEFVRLLSLFIQYMRNLIQLKNTQLQIQRKGINWEVDLNEAIEFNIFLTSEYEPELAKKMKEYIRVGDTVIDIGANIGAHTLPLAQLVGKNGHIYAIEPTDYAIEKLKKNIDLNPNLKDRITTLQAFLADITTTLPESVSASWSINKTIRSENRNQLDMGFGKSIENATKITLDELVEERLKLSRLDAIKIDIDGYEVDLLRGAEKTLERFSPLIFIEFSPIHYEGQKTNFEEQVNILTEHGYTFKDSYGNELTNDPNEIIKKIPRGVLLNVIAQKTSIGQRKKIKNTLKLKQLKEKLNEYMKKQRQSWSYLKVMKPGYASKKLYAIYMIETYHYTYHNSRNQAAVATRKDPLDINYMKFCLHHAEEEAGHEMMAFSDVRKLGFDIHLDQLPKPLPSTQELIDYIYDVAQNHNPVARLGYSFWAERVYSYIKPLLTLMKYGARIPNKSMTFFNEHSDIDAKHAEEVDEAIIRFARTDEDWEAITECMLGTLDRTIKMTHEVLHEYDKILNNEPTRYDHILMTKK